MRHPNIEEMKEILREAGPFIKMVTIAPELPGGIEMVEFLKEKGIVVSIAHSDATYEEAKDAFAKGASHVPTALMVCAPFIIEILAFL